ncbi:hypothetical protein [Paraburkholderia sp. J69-2]|uniref:hypothetical protein n=1 Tax=Paraburkholderia sp. J69-2 TaxID=2805437 RepID=UPI002AAF6ABC|nr:hypothetical protein [Paraburkholderia sp. J69-2]
MLVGWNDQEQLPQGDRFFVRSSQLRTFIITVQFGKDSANGNQHLLCSRLGPCQAVGKFGKAWEAFGPHALFDGFKDLRDENICGRARQLTVQHAERRSGDPGVDAPARQATVGTLVKVEEIANLCRS